MNALSARAASGWSRTLVAAAVPFAVELFVKATSDPLFLVGAEELVWTVGLVLVIALLSWLGTRPWKRWQDALACGLSCAYVLTTTSLNAIWARLQPTGISGRIAALLLALLVALALATLAARLAYSLFAGGRAALVVSFAVALLVAAGMLALRSDGGPAAARPHAPPDVALIILDTLRADHLSAFGYDRPTTPALANLSRSSQVYLHAWSPAPWTPPAHASILTGLLPAEHDCDLGPLTTPYPTLAELLSRRGYATLGVVNNPMLAAAQGWGRGFDDFRELVERPRFSASWPSWLIRRRDEDWRFGGDALASLRIVRRWWARHAGSPRFVMVNLVEPHSPYGTGAQQSGIFLDERLRAAASLPDDSEPYDAGLVRAEGIELEKVVALYDADVRYLDDAIGGFLAWLEGRRELDVTLVIVTADHGERLGERGLLGHQLGLDEVLLRVPLIVRQPRGADAGLVSKPVQTHGIFATVLAAAGVAAPALQVAVAPALELQESETVVAQMRHQGWYLRGLEALNPHLDSGPFAGDWASISDGSWKLVRSSAGTLRLYDLPRDPGEMRDLSAERPEVVARLGWQLDRLPVFTPKEGGNEISDETRERLRSLGYVQ